VGGFLITYSGYSYIMGLPDKTPEQVELFWTYNSPNVAMMTIACFLMVYRIKIAPDSRIAAWLANLTTCGFGIYMIHYFFVYLGYEAGIWLHIPTPLRIPFSALVILICSWTIVALIKRFMGRWATILMG
jgi:surface polysaccharide O-acyltransferase-like enzyme